MKTLYQSAFCSITNYLCECTDCALSKPEYQEKFSFCFIRRGNFLFKAFRSDLDSFTGRILLNKPGYEYRIAHLHDIPDECTIFSFNQDYYGQLVEFHGSSLNGFLKDLDTQSILIRSTPAIDYIHYSIFNSLSSGVYTTLQVDGLLSELVEGVFLMNPNESEFYRNVDREKRSYLSRIEKAKEFIQNSFADPIYLQHIAHECAMSPFHFARIFKNITAVSPYQYLLNFRLNHSEYLLKTTPMTVSEICYLSGFNNPAHYSFAFTQRKGISPSSFRLKQAQV